MITWITGNSKSGKTFLANRMRKNEIILDGDALRAVWPGLGFTIKDRWEQNCRAARLAVMLEAQGFDVIVATICPYTELRNQIKEMTNCRFIYLEGGETGEDYPYEK